MPCSLCRQIKRTSRAEGAAAPLEKPALRASGRPQLSHAFTPTHDPLDARSFQTLVTPDATEAYKRHAQKKGWGANGVSGGGRPGGGGGGGGGGRPRFGGMSNVRSIDHSARPAACQPFILIT